MSQLSVRCRAIVLNKTDIIPVSWAYLPVWSTHNKHLIPRLILILNLLSIIKTSRMLWVNGWSYLFSGAQGIPWGSDISAELWWEWLDSREREGHSRQTVACRSSQGKDSKELIDQERVVLDEAGQPDWGWTLQVLSQSAICTLDHGRLLESFK